MFLGRKDLQHRISLGMSDKLSLGKKNPYSQSHGKAQSSLFYNLVICERHSKNLSKSYFHSHTGPLPEFGLVYESHS